MITGKLSSSEGNYNIFIPRQKIYLQTDNNYFLINIRHSLSYNLNNNYKYEYFNKNIHDVMLF